ncbi:MAG: hypothetical protein LBN99_08500 [Oscillospiraceae bacterium]|jgi:hypothetical protein|nr:hypothetical protein [Oscillospiraceae bacterium]
MQKWIVVAVLVVVFIVASIVSSIRGSRRSRERRWKKESKRDERDWESERAYERNAARRELEKSAFWDRIKKELRQNARAARVVGIYPDRGVLTCRGTLDDVVSDVELYKIDTSYRSGAERALTATELDALADMCVDELAAFQLECRVSQYSYTRDTDTRGHGAAVTVERPDLVPRRPY